MTQLVKYILLSAMLLHTFSSLFINVDYLVNMEQIILEYCVNKDKPELQCNGKCHLAKELADDDNRKGEEEVRIVEIACSSLNTRILIEPKPELEVKLERLDVRFLDRRGRLLLTGVFHPPC